MPFRGSVNSFLFSTFIVLGTAAVLVVTSGCAATTATGHPAVTSVGEAAAPATTESAANTGHSGHALGGSRGGHFERNAEPTDDEILTVIARAQGEFDLGVELLQDGDTEQAREHWDHAVEAFIDSGIPLHTDPRLQGAFDRILDDIAALETKIVEAAEDESDIEPAPSDEILDVNATISPEQADASRERIEPETREVTFDIPMVVNDKVLAWVDLFQNNPVFRKSFEGGFQRYGYYEPMIHRILKEEGLPSDLIFLAFLESTYKVNAYSRARAKGIWQFMTFTGRQYGLRVDRYVDERSHPEKSTRAAARYLKDLHATFNDWHLAMAAYNTGAGNILRGQRRSGKQDYWSLARTRYMHRDTKNFVPAILALALMAKDPGKYGFGYLKRFEPIEYDVVAVEGPTYLSLIARLSGTDEEQIRLLNPHLRRGVTPPGYSRYEVMVPQGRGEAFTTAYADLPNSEKVAKLDTVHRVRHGETLASIASRYGVSVSELTRTNGIRNPNRIRAGTNLTIPRGGEMPRASEVQRASASGPYHIVRRGDTLSGISRAYGVSLNRLYMWNDMNRRSVLRPGMRIRITSDDDDVEPAASTAQARLTYRVRRGDNLFRIAQKYGTTVDNIKAWNNIRGDTIRAGDTLTIYSE